MFRSLRRPGNSVRSRHSLHEHRLAIEPLEYRLTLTTLPAGFVETTVASGMANPTAMEFAPDGRLFVAQQGGQLRVIKNGSLLATPFVSLTVNSSGERGLLGIAFDPNFGSGPGQNQYVYLYYTATTPTIHNRVSRFTANGDVVVPGSEQVLLDLPTLSATNHNGGAIHFGGDGMLYIVVGDNAVRNNAPLITSPMGKILRIAPDGAIPEDNPFYTQTTGINRAIWAKGLRNPFTFDFNAETNRMFVNDVGENTWEEINDGVRGVDYGWPATEGETSNPAYSSPLFAYGHGVGPTTGFAIAGGAFYDSPTKQFPSSYNGDYFFADNGTSWIRVYDPVTDIASAFATGLTPTGPVDLKVDSAGALYFLSRGSGGQVRKITYPAGQTAPTISDQPDSQTVPFGQEVTFTVQVQANGPVSYQWRKGTTEIPGATSDTYVIPSVSGDDEGAYSVVVTGAFGTATSNPANLDVVAGVVARHIFYNDSAFDFSDPAANAADDVAIATDKQALLPGQTATLVNYTSYSGGINGIMIDMEGLQGTPTIEDFTFRVGNDSNPAGWTAPATLPTVHLRPSAGVNGSDRVTLVWASGAPIKQWLQITVNATPTTNLASSDVFYFGNAIGESGNAPGNFQVTAIDEIFARNNPRGVSNPAPITFLWDYNRDTRVTATDQILARNNRTTVITKLQQITPPGPAAALEASRLADALPASALAADNAGANEAGPALPPRLSAALQRLPDRAEQRVRRAIDAALTRGEEVLPDYERVRRLANEAIDRAGEDLAELIATLRSRR